MAVFNGPPRAGSRGGRDQFNWEDVRADKDREYYLGHSVKALTGRWQKGKDVYWYTREQQSQGATVDYEDEVRAVKEHEEQLMAEALGIKPKASHTHTHKLDEQERKQLLKRNNPGADEDEEDQHGKGLGYSKGAMAGVSTSARLEGYNELDNQAERLMQPPRAHQVAHAAKPSGNAQAHQPAQHGHAPSSDGDDSAELQKRSKRKREERHGSPARKEKKPMSHKGKKHKAHKEHRGGKERKHKTAKEKKHRSGKPHHRSKS